MSEPKNHHFLPVFYMKRWCISDGRLCQYTRPHRDIHKSWKYPTATGFERGLYEQKGCIKGEEQIIEKRFMQVIDDKAANAVNELELGNISENGMFAWSAFLLSLDMRNPQSVARLKSSIGSVWEQKLYELQDKVLSEYGEKEYQYTKKILKSDPEFSNRHALSLLTKLIEHPDIRQIIHGMEWLVRSIRKPLHFLTSDAPLIMTATLSEENAYIILPIGPQKIFIAAKDKATAQIFERLPDEHLAAQVNRIVAGRAKQYVYASDDSMLEFVNTHMGTRQSPNLIERASRANINQI